MLELFSALQPLVKDGGANSAQNQARYELRIISFSLACLLYSSQVSGNGRLRNVDLIGDLALAVAEGPKSHYSSGLVQIHPRWQVEIIEVFGHNP